MLKLCALQAVLNSYSCSEEAFHRVFRHAPDTEMEGWQAVFGARLIRVYPSPSSQNISSENYNPVPMWCRGSQLVALNLQTTGLPYSMRLLAATSHTALQGSLLPCSGHGLSRVAMCSSPRPCALPRSAWSCCGPGATWHRSPHSRTPTMLALLAVSVALAGLRVQAA